VAGVSIQGAYLMVGGGSLKVGTDAMVQFTKRPPMMCNQIRKVSSAPISYRFSRNASFDDRNISSKPILIKLKIDGLFKV